ncbi:serpin family protein [Streptomyces sp. NPDC003042]
MRNSTVRAVNRLTTRWAAAHPSEDADTVFTAAGVWPLLALLADGAGGPARAELAQALGIPADAAAPAARELLAGLAGVQGLRTATGLWARADLALEERWLDVLPEGTRGTLTADAEADKRGLDAWAAERTGGLIERMPVTVHDKTRLVLASALALRLRWAEPFRPRPLPLSEGPWAGRRMAGLFRATSELDLVKVTLGARGPVTLLEVRGTEDTDVHLLLGAPGAGPGDVLTTGIAALCAGAPAVGAGALPEGNPGPGLTIAAVDSYTPDPLLRIDTVAFSLRAEHDLLERAPLFGLESATSDSFGHFPGISADPLSVDSARQSAMAAFDATGFEAAAVTAVAARPGAAPRTMNHRARRAQVAFHRPFGFLALDRTSRLVLAAGWVADPVTIT